MTKLKSKKMNKSTFAVIIMAIVMVAMMAFGGTYAYFTADAVNENVSGIKTAILELLNNGTDGSDSRLSYTSTNEIVPGQYLYGSGKLRPEASSDIYTWQKIHLSLNNTNAKAYAFVKVDVKAVSPSGNTLMVKYSDGSYAPVLKLTGRTDTPQGTVESTTTWHKFEGADGAQVGTTTSSYIFWYLIDDNTVERQRFEEVDFEFALQFDPEVMSDRKEVGGSYPETDGLEGYIPVPGDDKVMEKTNVYEEEEANKYSEKCFNIMGVVVEFKMDFRLIQALGFETEADAYDACFKGSDYTDDDLKDANHEKAE